MNEEEINNEEMFECKMYITDLETNKDSKEINIQDLVFDDYIEFEFGDYEDEDYSQLPYKDFKFFINDYSVTFYSPQYHKAIKEIDRLNNVIEIMEKYFELIIDLGYDYDGLNYEQDLKGLIDDILRFAKLGRVYNTTETIFVDRNKKYNILNEELKEEK